MYMLNGCGTTLYGKTRIEGEDAYIATKWFCLCWIPIVPIGSYVVFSESGTNLIIWSNQEYELAPLDKLYKPHLKAYLWTLLVVAAFIAIGSQTEYDDGGISLSEQIAFSENDRGLELAAENKFFEAIPHFDTAILAMPSSAVLWTNRGSMYSEISEFRKAIADFTTAIDRDSIYAPAYCHRAGAFFELNHLDSAVADYNRAIAIDPEDGAAYYGLGYLFYHTENYVSSLKSLNRCLELNFDMVDLFCLRGFVFLAMDSADRSLEDAQAALDFYPTLPEALFLKAVALDNLGQEGTAIETYRSYLEYADSTDTEQLDFAVQRLHELKR